MTHNAEVTGAARAMTIEGVMNVEEAMKVEKLDGAASGLSDVLGFAGSEEVDDECNVPPIGWRCTRGKGHIGPCAAVECPEDVALVARGMARLKQAELTKKHGTPPEFAVACYQAVPAFMSMAEARDAVDAYAKEWFGLYEFGVVAPNATLTRGAQV